MNNENRRLEIIAENLNDQNVCECIMTLYFLIVGKEKIDQVTSGVLSTETD